MIFGGLRKSSHKSREESSIRELEFLRQQVDSISKLHEEKNVNNLDVYKMQEADLYITPPKASCTPKQIDDSERFHLISKKMEEKS